jgi:hypothetical protein
MVHPFANQCPSRGAWDTLFLRIQYPKPDFPATERNQCIIIRKKYEDSLYLFTAMHEYAILSESTRSLFAAD